MVYKRAEHQDAISLRKQGFSYSQILERVNVSKSTLSYWLRDVALTERQKEDLDKRRLCCNRKSVVSASAVFVANRRRDRESILNSAREWAEGIKVAENPIVLVGAALYWAEGSKRRSTLTFANSDPEMIRVYVYWLRKILEVPDSSIYCKVHVHLDNGYTEDEVLDFWSSVVRLPQMQFRQTLFVKEKRNKRTRKTIHPYGVLRVMVRRPMQYHAKVTALLEYLGKEEKFID